MPSRDFKRTDRVSAELRRVPELRFKYDDSVDKGERIDELLRQNPAHDADHQD
jgi:ribosome-binding factor A